MQKLGPKSKKWTETFIFEHQQDQQKQKQQQPQQQLSWVVTQSNLI